MSNVGKLIKCVNDEAQIAKNHQSECLLWLVALSLILELELRNLRKAAIFAVDGDLKLLEDQLIQ